MQFFEKMIGCVVALAFLTNATGCAAMFHGTSQQIAIRSNHADAELYVNEAYVGKGNAVTVFKKAQNYTITVRKDGCEPFSLPASKSFDAITLLGILIDFGVISILVVDGAATGAWSEFDQTSYVIDPKCATIAPAAQRTSAPRPGVSM